MLFIPWLVHGSYDFFLTLSPNINNSSASVFVAIIAFGFYLFGLIYVRLLSLKVWREDSQCGQGVSIDIHQKITYPQVLSILLFFIKILNILIIIGSFNRSRRNSSMG